MVGIESTAMVSVQSVEPFSRSTSAIALPPSMTTAATGAPVPFTGSVVEDGSPTVDRTTSICSGLLSGNRFVNAAALPGPHPAARSAAPSTWMVT